MEVFMHLIPSMTFSFLGMVLDGTFWLVVLLVGYLHWRQAKLKETLFGAQDHMPWYNTTLSLLFGLAGGFVGSVLMMVCGISISGIGVLYLWLVAIGLFLISPRYLCFSYAGGLLSISSILFGFPKIDVPNLMALVAVLHVVESLLILSSGHIGAIPVYTRNLRGELVGGFNLQRFWPLPIIALVMVSRSGYAGSVLNMPDWWPLISSGMAGMENMMYAGLGVFAALGYSDIAVTNSPQEKSRYSAALLAVYSISLLGLCILASRYPQLAVLPALFGPLAHEYTIVLGQNRELKGTPVYMHPSAGVMVLDILKGSVGKKLGLNSRDIILSINGLEVNDKYQVKEAVAINSWWTELEYTRGPEGEVRKGFARKKVGEPLGIILVPGPGDVANVKFNPGNSILGRLRPPKKGYQSVP